jgi:phosphoglycolate phosphatase-like HAD superfamily hydrolase
MTSTAPVVTVSPRDYDAVWFDFDGVLTKTASVHAAAWQLSSKRGIEAPWGDPGDPPARKRCTRWAT